MTETLDNREDPLNLGGGWASSAHLGTWSSCHRRHRGAPIYKRRYRYGPKADYEPPRKQPRQQHGPGPWFHPPRWPSWDVYSNWRPWGGPWRPPPLGFRKPPRPVQLIRVYGLHPFCLCCCSCLRGPWIPGWARPPGWKKRWGRWGRRGRGLRRHPRRSCPRSPPVDLSMLLRPVNLYGWRAPGMRAPRNTTQFIMNQIYEDMRQQEELERQQGALREQQAQGAGGSPTGGFPGNESPSGGEEEAELPETLYSFVENPSLVFGPDPDEENSSPIPQLAEEEEKNEGCEERCEERCEEESEEEPEEESEEEPEEESEEEPEEEPEEESEEEPEEESEEEEYGGEGQESGEGAEADQVDMEEADYVQEGQEGEGYEEELDQGLEEGEPREEENNHLPLEMPLSFLVGAEEERENFLSCAYLSLEPMLPKGPQEALLTAQDMNCC